ncbi:hypothetical protein CO180_00975 [candidate division WWE3 bacterium CG_4_9_14_3_um_filter_41_6]|uniref:Type IV secretion system coupling protein TraD DNA-binding domain-containing protein n=1 Tax=candidate division WWE3 bacterium CG_4_10_14_0_2_um_filter_41_14 TaxID=1975072 RepID=A0A2M7TG79_UNCKA|nr:MAG: hypothetical protein COY32_05845 [candidate division WWE3 bacterium CG_4_10_14_0_2_um_filter_41_14]PJA39347.1 MAG: hypothetical protein CO180_00975 [candidate division WWE3 bacterium CG_4_9_14_3_um_filter_41_6]
MIYALVILLVSLAILSFGMAIKTVRDSFVVLPDAASDVSEGILLMIKVPKQNEQTPLAAEMMFSAIHGLRQDKTDVGVFSFEIRANHEGIFFYSYVPKKHQKFVESQIYAQYPTAEIAVVDDYTKIEMDKDVSILGTEIVLDKPFYSPIKSFPDFEVDPLAAITGSVEQLGENEEAWFQVVVKPSPVGWQDAGYRKIKELKTGKKQETRTLPQVLMEALGVRGVQFIVDIIMGIVQNPSYYMEDRNAEEKKYEMDEEAKAEIENIRKKLSLLGYSTSMRIIGFAPTEAEAQQNVGSMVAAFKQFASGEMNSFSRSGFIVDPQQLLSDYRARKQAREKEKVFILNTEELASIYHLPSVSVSTPNIDYILSKKSEPPLDLPTDSAVKFAKTTFRNKQVEFGVRSEDRRRHMYVIGKTGTGKTTLLRNMIIQDIRAGNGVAVIDPHGDLFDYVLDYIPQERVDDVVIFSPSDFEYPVALNMFELSDPDQKGLVVSGLIDVFRKRFEFSWGPRMEHLLRNTFLTFLEIPHSTLLGVTRILVDRSYRKYIVNLVEDPILKDFWNNEFEQIMQNDRLAAEAVGPIQNRLGPFLATPTIRNLVGQAGGTVNLREIMDTKKILLCNLTKGGIGEDNSSILGAFLVGRLWFAAMSRADTSEENRVDFQVYVDEFQNFATSSFASILSESRKYRLNLTIAHQYISQLESGGDSTVKDAVFGNVGTIVSYVVGQEDAEVLAKEFEPVFESNDLISLGKYQLYLKLMVGSQQSRPFSAVALPPITDADNLRQEVIAHSRATYGRPRAKVEAAVKRWAERTFAPGMDDDVVKLQRAEMFKKPLS